MFPRIGKRHKLKLYFSVIIYKAYFFIYFYNGNQVESVGYTLCVMEVYICLLKEKK